MASGPCRETAASAPTATAGAVLRAHGSSTKKCRYGSAAGGVFVARDEEMFAVGDCNNLPDALERGEAVERLLQQAAPVRQLDERLGMGLARDRPQAHAAAAGEDEWYQHGPVPTYRGGDSKKALPR